MATTAATPHDVGRDALVRGLAVYAVDPTGGAAEVFALHLVSIHRVIRGDLDAGADETLRTGDVDAGAHEAPRQRSMQIGDRLGLGWVETQLTEAEVCEVDLEGFAGVHDDHRRNIAQGQVPQNANQRCASAALPDEDVLSPSQIGLQRGVDRPALDTRHQHESQPPEREPSRREQDPQAYYGDPRGDGQVRPD